MFEIREKLRQLLELVRTERARFPIDGTDPAWPKDYDTYSEDLIADATAGTDEELARFLKSDEIWGGSGSIADQVLMGRPRDSRRKGEALLIEVGELQVALGVVNSRTAMWVDAFRHWQHEGR